MNDKTGFTLIEIIVVLVIIGILASIALPNLFSNVQTSQGSSALQTAASLESPLESCLVKYSTVAPGTSPCGLSNVASNGTSATLASAGNGLTVDLTNPAGTASATNTLSYELIGYNGSTAAFELYRQTTGIFTCTPGGPPYTNVC